MTKQLFLPPHKGEIKRASNDMNVNRVRIRKRHPEIPDTQIPTTKIKRELGKTGLLSDLQIDLEMCQSAFSS